MITLSWYHFLSFVIIFYTFTGHLLLSEWAPSPTTTLHTFIACNGNSASSDVLTSLITCHRGSAEVGKKLLKLEAPSKKARKKHTGNDPNDSKAAVLIDPQ